MNCARSRQGATLPNERQPSVTSQAVMFEASQSATGRVSQPLGESAFVLRHDVDAG